MRRIRRDVPRRGGGSSETCKYFFKVEGATEAETFVQVYAPPAEGGAAAPNDPFFSWKKVGKAYITEKAKSPKAAPMAAAATGLYLPGKGYSVSVNASTKVCTEARGGEARPVDEVAHFSSVPNRRSISGTVTLKFTAAIRPRM